MAGHWQQWPQGGAPRRGLQYPHPRNQWFQFEGERLYSSPHMQAGQPKQLSVEDIIELAIHIIHVLYDTKQSLQNLLASGGVTFVQLLDYFCKCDFWRRIEMSELILQLPMELNIRYTEHSIHSFKIQSHFIQASLDTLLYWVQECLSCQEDAVKAAQRYNHAVQDSGEHENAQVQADLELLTEARAAAKSSWQRAEKILELVKKISLCERIHHTPFEENRSMAATIFLWIVKHTFPSEDPEHFYSRIWTHFGFSPKIFHREMMQIMCHLASCEFSDYFFHCLTNHPDFLEISTRCKTVPEYTKVINNLIKSHKKLAKKIEKEKPIWMSSNSDVETETEGHCRLRHLEPMCRLINLIDSHSFRAQYYTEQILPSRFEDEYSQLTQHLANQSHDDMYVVRQETRPDLLRCVMAGPMETPYSRGLFVFDLYIPQNYPDSSPHIKCITNGYGTVNFSNHLTLDGTFQPNDECNVLCEEDGCHLYTLLRSVQKVVFSSSAVLPCDHGTSDGNGERDATATEDKESQWEVQNLTVRYAMLEQMNVPPAETSSITSKYMEKHATAILNQCKEWIANCETEEIKNKLIWNSTLLRQQLEKQKPNKTFTPLKVR